MVRYIYILLVITARLAGLWLTTKGLTGILVTKYLGLEAAPVFSLFNQGTINLIEGVLLFLLAKPIGLLATGKLE